MEKQYKSNHEIIYADDFGRGKIEPGQVLTKENVEALGDAIESLLKAKAISVVKGTEEVKSGRDDGFKSPSKRPDVSFSNDDFK